MNNLFDEQLFHKYLDKIEITQKHKDKILMESKEFLLIFLSDFII